MKTENFANFQEFWPYYLSEHKNGLNRRLHFIGTTLVCFIVLAAMLLRDPRVLLLAPVGGYGFAWVGHFGVEKNRPATFRHPLWSLRGDFRMYGKMLRGQLWGPTVAA